MFVVDESKIVNGTYKGVMQVFSYDNANEIELPWSGQFLVLLRNQFGALPVVDYFEGNRYKLNEAIYHYRGSNVLEFVKVGETRKTMVLVPLSVQVSAYNMENDGIKGAYIPELEKEIQKVLELIRNSGVNVSNKEKAFLNNLKFIEKELTDKTNVVFGKVEEVLNEVALVEQESERFLSLVRENERLVDEKYHKFDTDITEANQTIDDILALKPQFQAVLDETTGKDVISAPEIILARGGEANLKARLDKEHQEVTAQLAQTNMQTISPLDYGEIKLPSDFPKLPFAIYRDNDDRIKHNFSTTQFEENLDRIYYVSKANGLDSNNGTSESTPLATLAGVFFKIGSNTNLKIKVIVLDNTLFYHGDISGGSIGSTYSIRDNNIMYFTTKDKNHRITATAGVANLVWSVESGYTKVFKASHTEALYNAVDLRPSNRDVYGLPKPYKKVLSIALVESTEGSYYVNGSTIYIHPIGGIVPNNVDVLACVSSYAVRFNVLANATLILENFDIIAGNPYFASSTPTTNTSLYTINCKVSEASANGLGSNHIKKVYHFNPVVGYSKRDNINYTFSSIPEANRRECLGFEYNATAYQSGYNDKNENNNASTAHDGACTLRIGTTGYEARGPVIADVNGCYSIILDCKARDSIASNPINQNIFYFDDINSLVNGKAYIINSTAKGTENNKMLGSTEGFPIFLQLFKAKDLSKDLNITYVEGLPK